MVAGKLHCDGQEQAGRKGVMRQWAFLVIAVGVLSGSIRMSADEPVSITVRPSVVSYRGAVQLKVSVASDEKNRVLVWEVDGPGYYRSSTRDLAGAAAPRNYMFIVQDLPAGEFEVRATVRRNDLSAAVDSSSLLVVGGPS
jgi:hypothetical protein